MGNDCIDVNDRPASSQDTSTYSNTIKNRFFRYDYNVLLNSTKLIKKHDLAMFRPSSRI